MALFDFPRIHFSGDIDVNVPTINNSYYFPLTLYDQMRSVPLFPPRLYFSDKSKVTAVESPLNPEIFEDDINCFVYIEITPVKDIETLRAWCMQPIGEPGSIDIDYVPYYKAAELDLGTFNGIPIVGSSPGYWNMYGDMGVKVSNSTVTGVHTFDGKNIRHWKGLESDIPQDILSLVNASFDLDTTPGSGRTTAAMVETVSSQSVYANIFCSNVNLYDKNNPDIVFLQGNPIRFGALIYSAWRVLNWLPPMAGSGRFNAAIPLEDIQLQEQATLCQFFAKYNSYDSRKLKGVFISFVIIEVFENRYDQNYYKENGTKPNPARSHMYGSLTPWYEGDMQTGVPGRNLISLGQKPWYTNTNSVSPGKIPIMCTPTTVSLKDIGGGAALLSVDMGTTWPEAIIPEYSSGFKPTHPNQVQFETLKLGTFKLKTVEPYSTEICRIEIDPVSNPLSSINSRGGIFDFIISDPALVQKINSNLLCGFLDTGSEEINILYESEYMFCSDQKGLYSEQGNTPAMGYYVNSEQREPCRLRIFRMGKPVTVPVEVIMLEFIVPEGANDPMKGYNSKTILHLKDNDIVPLAAQNLELDNNAIYYFVYDGQYPDNKIPDFVVNNNYTIMDTGAFVIMRVHPFKDYSKYLNPSHPDYTVPTFEIVYDEVFKLYDVVYPVMALIHPFTKDVWDNGTMAGLVAQRTDRSYWNNILYMPRSREMSECQRQLVKAWAATFNA
jgi:hypothetical protein